MLRLSMLCFMAVVAVGIWEHQKAKHYSANATGTVVELTRAQSSGAGRGDSTPPRIEYTVAGKAYRFVQSRAVFDTFSFDRIGEAVPVRYDPAHPERAVVDRLWYRYPFTSMLGVLTILFAAASAAFAIRARNRIKHDA